MSHVSKHLSWRANAVHTGCSLLQLPRPAKGCKAGRCQLSVCAKIDYTACRTDTAVLQLPARTELTPDQIRAAFGYSRTFFQQYELGRCVGAGSFGIVRECREKATQQRFAVKTVPKWPRKGRATPRYLLKLQQEVDAMQQLGASLDAVYLKDVFEDDEHIHLVMELCEGGALLDRIRGNASEQYIAGLVRSVMRFIAQCHAKGIVFRDCKPDNFLFANTSPDSPLKATDFGLSIRHSCGEPPLKSRSGTPAYMAPELILQSYTEKADVWSVGMLTYQLLTGRFPFTDDVNRCTLQQVWQAILEEIIDFSAPHLSKLSPLALDFLRKTLHRSPKLRLSAAAALEHPWLKEQSRLPDMPLGGSVVQRLQRFATYSHLKQFVLRMIVEEMHSGTVYLNNGLLTDIEDVFLTMDIDHSGSLSLEELTDGLQQQGYLVSDGEVAQLMDRMDLNQDESLSFDELAAGLVDWDLAQQDENWRIWVEKVFRRLDIDGDGFISYDELLSHLNAETPHVDMQETTADARRMLRDHDVDDDGKISRNEFYDLLISSDLPDVLGHYDTRLPRVIDEELRSMDCLTDFMPRAALAMK